MAITKSTADAAREIKNLSNLIGTSTTEFQRMAVGAKTVGIEQDKLADIFKDVNDKIGDFMQTGAGPLVDFFEQVAPKIGVTADEFKNLSGPEALQKYVTGLEAANLSQAEMTFFMEAIASDAALLTPLLRDNGKGFKEMGDQAERAGAVLSDIEIEQLEQLNKKLVEGELAMTGFANKVATELSPQIVGLIDLFDSMVSDSEAMGEAISTSLNGVVIAVGVVGDAYRGWELIISGIVGASLKASSTIMTIMALVGDTTAAEVESSKAAIKLWSDDFDKLADSQLPSEKFAAFVEANKKAAEDAAAVVVEANDLKNEAADVQIDKELEDAIKKFDKLKEIESEYQAISGEAEDVFNSKKLTSKEKFTLASEKLEEASNKRKLSMASSAFGNLSSLMDTENRKLFEIGKVAALSQAIIDGYSSVLSSYKEGTKIGGPIVGAAFAATAGIATAVQISKISSASFGGGGAGGGGMAAGGSPNIPEPQAASAPAAAQDRNLVVSGFDSSTLITGDMLNGILEGINDAVEDGFVLRRVG